MPTASAEHDNRRLARLSGRADADIRALENGGDVGFLEPAMF